MEIVTFMYKIKNETMPHFGKMYNCGNTDIRNKIVPIIKTKYHINYDDVSAGILSMYVSEATNLNEKEENIFDIIIFNDIVFYEGKYIEICFTKQQYDDSESSTETETETEFESNENELLGID